MCWRQKNHDQIFTGENGGNGGVNKQGEAIFNRPPKQWRSPSFSLDVGRWTFLRTNVAHPPVQIARSSRRMRCRQKFVAARPAFAKAPARQAALALP